MAAMESEACQELAEEVRDVLRGADAQWRKMEAFLDDVEERTLREHTEDLQKWFGPEVSGTLSDWTEGGVRRKTRDRVQKLLLAPIDERIRQEVSLPGLHPADAEVGIATATDPKSHPIDMLLEHWDNVIEPMLGRAIKEDAKLSKKVRRLQKVHAAQEAKQEEEKRIALWESTHAALAVADKSARTLANLLSAELDGEKMTQVTAAVPSIVARSVCDWHFRRCSGEFDQLSGWWEGARAALQRQPQVWERLLEEEGVFVRRIERGIEEIKAEKSRYSALATFGHSGTLTGHSGALSQRSQRRNEWPAVGAALLARSVKEMKRRIGPIRDSAAWRVIDAAKAITREQKKKEGSPWEEVGDYEGMSALCRSLGIVDVPPGEILKEPKGIAAIAHIDPVDSALCFANMLDRLPGIITDLGKLVDDEGMPDTGGLSYILEEVLQKVSYVQEDLLGVMDDATEASLAAWLDQSWGKWGGEGGPRLEAAMSSMPLKADSLVRAERRQARHSQLALMRGLQNLLVNDRFRARLLDLAAAPLGARTYDAVEVDPVSGETLNHQKVSETFEFVDFDTFARSGPPAGMSLPASPRNGYVARSPQKTKHEETGPSQAIEFHATQAMVDIAPAALKSCREQEVLPPALQRHPESETHPPTPKTITAIEFKVAPWEPAPKVKARDTPKNSNEMVSSALESRTETVSSDAESSSHCRHSSTPAGQLKSPKSNETKALDLESSTRASPRKSSNSSGSANNLPPTPGRLSAALSAATRPVTPSWLDPPWSRSQEVPFQSWSRPGTASTVCEEGDLAAAPKYKFVDGQCIPMRPASSSTRLAPISRGGGYPMRGGAGRPL